MATASVAAARSLVSGFYVGMAWVFVAIAFGGFLGTYWLQIARGTFTGSPLLHLHGLLFSLWTLFFLSQAMLIANLKRPESHKRLMLVATTAVLQAPIARFFFLAKTGGGPGVRPGMGPPLPVSPATPAGLLVASLIVMAMVHDWRVMAACIPLIGGASGGRWPCN
jgi:hypothetical protein